MTERLDPVMKLAHHQPPCSLPSGWSATRTRDDEIVVSCPSGHLLLSRTTFSGIHQRVFYDLMDAMLLEQKETP